MQFYYTNGIKAKTVLISSLCLRKYSNILICNILYILTYKNCEDW